MAQSALAPMIFTGAFRVSARFCGKRLGTRLLRVDFVYDVYGNRIKRLEYDGGLSLVGEERFAYDAWKVDPYSPDSIQLDAVRVAHWDVWADRDGSNDLVTRRVFGDRVDELLARVSSAGTLTSYANTLSRQKKPAVPADFVLFV